MHKDDQMTPKERMAAYSAGEPIDRLPTMPFVGTISAKIAGMTLREKRQSAKNIANSLIVTYRRFGQDNISVNYELTALGKAMGSRMNDPEDAVPAILETVMQSLDDLDQLDYKKTEFKNDPDLRMQCEAGEMLLEQLGNECSVGASISGPFTAASGVLKVDQLLRAMRKDPERLHQLLRFSTDVLKMVILEFVNRGMGISFADPVASGTILKPEQYREFVKPYTMELMDYVHSLGSSISYHVCGQTIGLISDMVDTGTDILSLDNIVDLQKAKELAGDRVCMVGNVDPVGVMMLQGPSAVKEAIRCCFSIMHDSPKGYFLATGCDIPVGVPLENMEAYMEAARYYGKWPLAPERYQ